MIFLFFEKKVLPVILIFITVGLANGLLIGGVDQYTHSKDFKLEADEPMRTIQSFCPASFCFSNETMRHSFDFENTCCVPCDCSTSCQVFHKTGIADEMDKRDVDGQTHNEICVKTSVSGSGSFIEDTDEFLVVQSCPADKNGSVSRTDIGKCLQPNEKKIDEITPVYSTTTKKNYRNIYCAICNKDFGVKAWKSRVICQSILDMFVLFPSTRDRASLFLHSIRYFLKSCILKWEPELGTATLCIDQNSVISNCNLAHQNFEKFKTLCSEIYAPSKVHQTIYKNVFCLACNEDIDKCHTRLNLWPIHTSVEFKSEVYATGKYETQDIQESSGQCTGDLVYDSSLNQCIMKMCPLTQVKEGNTCMPILGKWTGAAFDYRLEVLYPKTVLSLPSYDKIFADIRPLVLHGNDTNSLCVEKIHSVAAEQEHFVVTLQLTKRITTPTTPFDDFDMFTDKIEAMNERTLRGELDFNVKISNSPLMANIGGFLSFTYYTDFQPDNGCFESIAMSSMIFCELVLLFEATCDDGNVYLSNGVKFLPGEYVQRLKDGETVMVCYDHYVTKMMAASGVVSSNTKGVHSFINSALAAVYAFYMIEGVLLV